MVTMDTTAVSTTETAIDTSNITATTAAPSTITSAKNKVVKVLAVETNVPDGENSSQWYYRPYLQPSSISTTATSSLVPDYRSYVSSHNHNNSTNGSVSTVSNNVSNVNSVAISSSTSSTTSSTSLSSVPTRAPTSIFSSLQASLASGNVIGINTREDGYGSPGTHLNRASDAYPFRRPAGSFHINPQLPPQQQQQQQQQQNQQQLKDDTPIVHNNPYKAPSHSNSRPFVPPKVPGYDFSGGSQAGNMGLLLGKRLSDGIPVTGKLHQSRVLLQHEYRILKRLQFPNARFVPTQQQQQQKNQPLPNGENVPAAAPAPPSMNDPAAATCGTNVPQTIGQGTDLGSGPPTTESGTHAPETKATTPKLQSTTSITASEPSLTTTAARVRQKDSPKNKRCQSKLGSRTTVYQTGSDETQRYYNRVIEDFVDLDQEDMSMLILERLGPNILSNQHHRFVGLEDVDGHHSPETQDKMNVGSPLPDVYTFLIFCLKMACVLESLLSSNLAHLNISPLFVHWAFPEDDDAPEKVTAIQLTKTTSSPSPSTTATGTTARAGGVSSIDGNNNKKPHFRSYKCFDENGVYQPMQEIDVNDTKIRLFDFTHSKILSHERARAPNNIVEWQVPGFLEYHLQFLAPEQTGRTETWMDHRTDIYGLGVTLFSLLTMQFPYTGIDSVQILQGVLSRDLPPLKQFRPDMPPVIDDILRKMTQKQPSQRYQNAFGFKQDILKCLNLLHGTGKIESFELGAHDISYQFVLPNTVYGRHMEQQMLSAAIAQAASAYQHSLNNDMDDTLDETEQMARRVAEVNNTDHYRFEDDIVSLRSQITAKISLSSKTLLRTPKPFDGGKSVHRGSETTDPVVRVIFVSGPSGVGKTVLIRGMSAVARNSGLFAAGIFEADNATPYSAILSCVQSVLQQLLAQHTEALASLVVAIRTAFEPNSGIGIICDLVPELKYFFSGSELTESKDVSLSHSVARFHALILKLIRVISTHFFMTWLIDDLQFADENSISLLATLVNVNKRLPIVLIITHRDSLDCLIKVKQILGGTSINVHSGSVIHQDPLANNLSNNSNISNNNNSNNNNTSRSSSSSSPLSSSPPVSKTSAIRATGLPLVVRGGGGVRFIRLQNPGMDPIQEFLATLLHRDKGDTVSLAKVLYQKSWLTIRQLVLELYRNKNIYFNCIARIWEWESDADKLAHVVRKLTGEEYAFLENRSRPWMSADVSASKQYLAAKRAEEGNASIATTTTIATTSTVTAVHPDSTADTSPNTTADNKGCAAMAGLQTALREGILVYTSIPDHLRFHHGIMRKVAVSMLDGAEQTEELHFQMAKILFRTPGQEFRTASHVLQSLNLIKANIAHEAIITSSNTTAATQFEAVGDDVATLPTKEQDEMDMDMDMQVDKQRECTDHDENNYMEASDDESDHTKLDTQALRMVLSLAGEKSQKSGAQDMALAYWKAALSLLPEDCWEGQREEYTEAKKHGEAFSEDINMDNNNDSNNDDDNENDNNNNSEPLSYQKATLYHETLKLHLQCIEAERWREHFDSAMEICDIVLAKVKNPIDRARVYQHQIEMSVWAYSRADQATAIAMQCMRELGFKDDFNFNPTEEEKEIMFAETHKMLLEHIDDIQAEPHKMCADPKMSMMMEVLSVADASLYYCNVPFMAAGIAYSMKVLCEHGITKDAGRALVSFALTHSTWYGCIEKAYELGQLACAISNGSHHVRFLFYLTVQQWGDHIANSIPAIDEAITAVDLTCDRLFHTSGMLHVSLMRVLLGRVHLTECMTTTVDLLSKHVEFGPKSHGVEVMHGVIQMIKCLKGRTLISNPETIFDDAEYSESKVQGKRDKPMTMVHNNSTYQLLKIVAALIFGHYAFIEQVADPWHDDPKSIMSFESSYLSHYIFMTVSLALVNLLRLEKEQQSSEVREIRQKRLKQIRNKMETHAKQYPINHAAMFYLLEAEIADQEEGDENLKKTLLLYEKAIAYSTEGDFPLFKCLAYELAGRCHLRHGLVTSAKCLMVNSLKGYQTWGAKGKVAWFHKSYPDMFPGAVEHEQPIVGLKRGLFYRPNDSHVYPQMHVPVGSTSSSSSSTSGQSAGTGSGSSGAATTTSPWLNSSSPKSNYSSSMFGPDAVSAAAAAMAESCLTSSFPTGSGTSTNGGSSNGCPSGVSSHASAISAPLYTLPHSWLGSPQSPEMDNADLDVLDFSSVIEAMQVIASEIDLDLLLIKSLGVLNQSVGAKRCCIIISKDQELVLAASQGDLGRCESVKPPMEVEKCQTLFHGVINYVINTSTPCLLTNAKDDPRFCADEYLKQRGDLKTVLCAPILHKAALVGVLYMEEFPERAFANKRMLVMNLLVQQLGISITNALLYQSVLQSEAKLNGLLENMPCGIVLWDANAETCKYINSGWSDMTGFAIEDIMSSSWQVLLPPDDLVAHSIAWRERVVAGKPCQWEMRYGLRDGTYRWGIVRMLPIKSSPTSSSQPGKILQWLTVTVDIDDQRRAVQLKSNFLANMSHELRTPFSGILGMLSLLRDSSGLSQEQFEFVDMAKASCEMLIRIVDDLLNFSKLEADKVTLEYIPLCFEEVLGDVCDLLIPLASKKGLELIVLLDPTLPLLLIGDPDRLKQIVMNLIGNAIKFSTSGNVVVKYWHERIPRNHRARKQEQRKILDHIQGHCKIDTTQYRAKHGFNDPSAGSSGRCNSGSSSSGGGGGGASGLSVDDEDGRMGDDIILHCSVTDQGIGLSPEEQKMLFVSFQQTDNGTTRKYGGTGLGLSICAQLIAHMNGKITVDSEKGKGSTFTFTANIRTATPFDQEQNPSESSRIIECQRVLHLRWDALRSRRVLILSPNKLLREQITKTIPGAEYVEFDDVDSVLQSGLLALVDGEDSGPVLPPPSSPQPQLPQQSLPRLNSDKAPPLSGLHQFDYILVDHVLDSTVLDYIYPSPTIAFILLLAPTTETLRWILPPAQKPHPHDDEEPESDQIDVGGRGRIQQPSDMDFAQRAMGRVNSVSYISALKGGVMGLPAVNDSSCQEKQECDADTCADEGHRKAKMLQQQQRSRPSQLFKKRKNSGRGGPVTMKRHDVPGVTYNNNEYFGPSFQVCRMIKPVRRLKLLQIMYNALMYHQQALEDPGVARVEEIVEDLQTRARSRSISRSVSPVTGVSTYSVSASLKRRRNEDKSQQQLGKGSDSSSATAVVQGTNADDIGGLENGTERNDPPKRARNNDALAFLLTQEERRRCRGINVLVAEDDFVSQKILEKQLSKLGMNVVIANNGQQAVNQWLAADRGHYTIAIFDHHMPIMDGLAATKKIRELESEMQQEHEQSENAASNILNNNDDDNKNKDNIDANGNGDGGADEPKKFTRIPIVGLSADIQHTTKERCIRAGMDEYMTKPLLAKGLALLIQRYCCS
ncbi:hypothetical protein BG004_005233 [Podila humilis]|nr:hypothetical protein BG004_005233 [Podila humilis]